MNLRCPACCALLALLGLASPALADSKAGPPPDRYEPGFLPTFGGDTDVGFKFGSFVQIARYRDGIQPYAWRARLLGEASVREEATGTEFPYRELYVRIDWPQAWSKSLRLLTEVGYLRTTNLGYYGIGNASHSSELWAGLEEGTDAFVQARRTYQYDGTTPQLRGMALWELSGAWHWFGDATLQWVHIGTYEGSLLQRDLARSGHGGPHLWGADEYVQPLFASGFAHDSRDHETMTTSGQFHDVSVRCAPRGFGAEPYCGLNATFRGFLPIAGEKLSLAGKLLGDVLTDRAPLIELSRYYGGLQRGSSFGGTRGIRGAPQGRWHGRTKALASVEVRSFLLPFHIGSIGCNLGLAAFFDAGRVWTGAFASDPELDGKGLGIHWGAGAGPRLRWGDSLIIRFDLAYSATGEEIGVVPGFYVDVEPVM